MINHDNHGNIWITRLSEDEVITVTGGNHYSNQVLALPKGHPTKVIYQSSDSHYYRILRCCLRCGMLLNCIGVPVCA